MANQFPVALYSVADLAQKGISKDSCKFGSLSMESYKYIAVRDSSEGNPQLVVVYLEENGHVVRKTMKADSGIMHPEENTIVLKAKNENGHYIQAYNFETKQKLASHQFPEQIVFWKWVEKRTLGIVTEKSVYHWSIEGNTPPYKIIDRSGKLAESNVQITNYIIDSQQKWCAVVGLCKEVDPPGVTGSIQLYSFANKQNRMLEGHSACFGEIMMEKPRQVFCYTEKKKDQGMKLHILDIFTQKEGGGPGFKATGDIQLPHEQANDFPIALFLSKKYGVIFIVTKNGFIHLYDAFTASLIFRHRISQEAIFTSCYNEKTGGILAANRAGLILSCTVNENSLIPFIQANLSALPTTQEMIVNLSRRYGLPGADDFLVQIYNQHFAKGEYKEAAQIVAKMKSGALRTPQVLESFRDAPSMPGQPSPIFVYFHTLLEYGKLNALESKEIATPLVQQGKLEYIEKWLKDDLLECTEELGDIVKAGDPKIALAIYIRANTSPKIVQSLIEMGQYEQIIQYCIKANYQADFTQILQYVLQTNPDSVAMFSKRLLTADPPLIDINQVVELLLQVGKIQELTSILLEYLNTDRAEDEHLQTKLLEMNLLHAPSRAEAIFQIEKYTHFDKPRIAALCEQAGLFQRALEFHGDIANIKRILMRAGGQISGDWIQQYFGKLSPQAALEILTDMFRTNRQDLNTVVSIAIKFHERLGVNELINMFESFSSYEGIFYFLGSILSFNQDPNAHFKYIEAASKLNQIQEVERCVRESKYYDPVQVKDFLKLAKLSDPRPLIVVCDINGFVEELTEYLYKNSLLRYLEVYVLKVNPLQTPTVVGTLMDYDCPEDVIKNILNVVRGMCPVAPLVEEMEKRNALRILLPWLESRMAEGNQEIELHNALAKIYIDTNKDPETFLRTNLYYDSKVIGKFCEDRDPHLAFAAYKRANGTCDHELIEITNKNGLYRMQARYLVERKSFELWVEVLTNDTEHRKSLIDQVISTALPESTNPDEVSVVVRAFNETSLQGELIELLEKIVLHTSSFSSSTPLQNLLLLTAIRMQSHKVMDYVNRLDSYDGAIVAACASEKGMFKEAFQIYRKFDLNQEATDALLKDDESLERAMEFAARVDDPRVWSKVAAVQLKNNLLQSSLECYLKANDASNYKEVITALKGFDDYGLIIKYLQLAKQQQIKDQLIDSELVYSFAKSGRLTDLENFINSNTTANVLQIGDRLFAAEAYEAAKTLYESIPNYSKVALCHLFMGEYSLAVDAAKRVNSPKTWKEVSLACLAGNELDCAHAAGLALIIHPDHLEELIQQYEYRGFFSHLIKLLEAGISGERTHVGMFTELGIAYAKYKRDGLMDFCRQYYGRLSISKLIRACEKYLLWKEAVFLHYQYEEYDQAASIMMNHSPSAFESELFVKIMLKVSNAELYYQAIVFYIENYPTDLMSLVGGLQDELNHARTVNLLKSYNAIPLCEDYLTAIQSANIATVNEALNELLLSNCSYKKLRLSVMSYGNFDQLGWAKRLQDLPTIEMRRVAALLYKGNKQFKESLDISLKDRHYQDAIETVAYSQSHKLVEELLEFFIEINDPNCFSAALNVCYDFLLPDVVLELSWRNGWIDAAMPYIIQVLQEYTHAVNSVNKKVETREKKDEKQKSSSNDYLPDIVMGAPRLPGMGNLALTAPPLGGQFSGAFGGAPQMMGNAMPMSFPPLGAQLTPKVQPQFGIQSPLQPQVGVGMQQGGAMSGVLIPGLGKPPVPHFGA